MALGPQVPPRVTSVEPANAKPGDQVVVRGEWFIPGVTVGVGGIDAAAAFRTSTWCVCTVPWQVAGAKDVDVATDDGALTATAALTVEYDPPTITALDPDSGDAAGGTSVLVTGVGFEEGMSFLFDGEPATNVVVASYTSATLDTPAHAAGAVSVAGQNTGGLGDALVDGFTYN